MYINRIVKNVNDSIGFFRIGMIFYEWQSFEVNNLQGSSLQGEKKITTSQKKNKQNRETFIELCRLFFFLLI